MHWYMYASILLLGLLGFVNGNSLAVKRLAARDCQGNNCLRALRGSAFPARSASADCSSFLLTTVTPATRTFTATLTVRTTPQVTSRVQVTTTPTTTSTIDETTTPTVTSTREVTTTPTTTTTIPTTSTTFLAVTSGTDVSTVATITTTGTTLQTVTASVTDVVTTVLSYIQPPFKKRQVTVRPVRIPAYASACDGAAAYSSACSCIGVSASVTTVAAPSTTITITASVTTTATSLVTDINTTTATNFVTDTDTTTATDTTTRTATTVATDTAIQTSTVLQTTTVVTTGTRTGTSTTGTLVASLTTATRGQTATASVFALQAVSGNFTDYYVGVVQYDPGLSPGYRLNVTIDAGAGLWHATGSTDTNLWSVNRRQQRLLQRATDGTRLFVVDSGRATAEGLRPVLCSIDQVSLLVACRGPSGAVYGWCQCEGEVFLCATGGGVCANGRRDEFQLRVFYVGART